MAGQRDPETVGTDVIVLGLGTSGEDLALRLLDSGLEVVGIEPALLGGECPYWACIPTKMMVRAAKLVAEARRMNGVAGEALVTPDWAPVAARIRAEATADWNDSVAVARFEGKGGRFVRARGRLVGPNAVEANGQRFLARRGIVIATGSKPAVPPIPGLSEVEYWTTHDAIQADPLPESLVVLGGGAVGCELSQVFARFGVAVTIVEGGTRLLPSEEPEVDRLIRPVLEADGITVRTGVNVVGVAHDGDRAVIDCDDGSSVSGERLLVATGRVVDVGGLGLDTAGVSAADGFVEVDGRMRAADGIWAIGDVTGRAKLTSVAMYQGGIAASDILGEGTVGGDYRAVPRVTFTDPEVGAVGLTEGAARDAGHVVDVVVKDVAGSFRGWLHGPGNAGFVKLVIDRHRDVLLGATAAGPYGGEVLGLLNLAVHEEVQLGRLVSMEYGFPTFYGVIGECLGAYGRGTGKVLDPGFEPRVG